MNTTLPQLTFHAIDLQDEFSGINQLLETFVNGCPDLDGRQRDAVMASIVAAFLDYNHYDLNIQSYSDNPVACSRLLLACLIAESLNHNSERDGYFSKCIAILEKGINRKNFCDLFINMPYNPMRKQLDIEYRAGISQGVCIADIRKMVGCAD